jgi:hypothetical protein
MKNKLISPHCPAVRSDLKRFDEHYKGQSNLNLVSLVESATQLSKEDLQNPKSLTLYISHRGEVISVGRLGRKIVFMSYTAHDNLLSSRRIFEAMQDGTFFRYINEPSEGLSKSLVSFDETNQMARVVLFGFETGEFQLEGCLNFDLSKAKLNGVVFGSIVNNLIEEITHGHKINTDKMINRLEGVLKRLGSLAADKSLTDKQRREMAFAIAKDWLERDELFLSKRPRVRQLYAMIKTHKFLTQKQNYP